MCNGIETGREWEGQRGADGDVEVYVVSVVATAFYLPCFLFYFLFFGVRLRVFTDCSWFFDFLTRVRRQSLWHFNCLFAQFAHAKPPGPRSGPSQGIPRLCTQVLKCSTRLEVIVLKFHILTKDLRVNGRVECRVLTPKSQGLQA